MVDGGRRLVRVGAWWLAACCLVAVGACSEEPDVTVGSLPASSVIATDPRANEPASDVPPCIQAEVDPQALYILVIDHDAARRDGVLSPDLDVGRVVVDDPDGLERLGVMIDYVGAVGADGTIATRSTMRTNDTPYGPRDVRCLVTSSGPGYRADSVVLSPDADVVSTADAAVSISDGLATVTDADTSADLVPLADAAEWARLIVEEFVAAEVVTGRAQTREVDGVVLAAGVGAIPRARSIVVVWHRPDLASAELEALARRAIDETGPTGGADIAVDRASVRVVDHVAVISVPAPDPLAAMETLLNRMEPLVASGLGLSD